MKKISLFLMAFGLVATSCTKDEFDTIYEKNPHADFAQQFAQTFGEIAPNHDWGFGTVRGASMRAASTWDGKHTCGVNWTDTIAFEFPSEAVTVTADTKLTGGNYYVPATFTGKVNFDNNFNGNIYVAGTVTGYDGSNQSKTNIYILKGGSWSTSFTSGEVYFYNNGTLNLGGADLQNSNVKAIYNANKFIYSGTNTNNSTYLYSTGTVELTADNVDFKLICDVHNTVKAKNVKIQNGTAKYICEINATGTVHNVDGPLYVSTLIADKFTFDGNPIYLTEEGHIKANMIDLPNGNCHVHAVDNSIALVEVGDVIMVNDNDFERTFSSNIFFKVTGYIDFSGVTNGNLKERKKFDNAEAYIAANGNPNDHLNAGVATGTPACGDVWTVGTPKEGTLRIIAEDLGDDNDSDFDYNDVVFDAYINDEGYAEITLQAAGGTLPLYVAGEEVHAKFGVSVTTMVNTGAPNGATKDPVTYTSQDIYKSVKDIPVVVYRVDNTQLTLKTENGLAPEKIAVSTEYKWTDERQAINKKYPLFDEYVSNPGTKWYQK